MTPQMLAPWIAQLIDKTELKWDALNCDGWSSYAMDGGSFSEYLAHHLAARLDIRDDPEVRIPREFRL